MSPANIKPPIYNKDPVDMFIKFNTSDKIKIVKENDGLFNFESVNSSFGYFQFEDNEYNVSKVYLKIPSNH